MKLNDAKSLESSVDKFKHLVRSHFAGTEVAEALGVVILTSDGNLVVDGEGWVLGEGYYCPEDSPFIIPDDTCRRHGVASSYRYHHSVSGWDILWRGPLKGMDISYELSLFAWENVSGGISRTAPDKVSRFKPGDRLIRYGPIGCLPGDVEGIVFLTDPVDTDQTAVHAWANLAILVPTKATHFWFHEATGCNFMLGSVAMERYRSARQDHLCKVRVQGNSFVRMMQVTVPRVVFAFSYEDA